MKRIGVILLILSLVGLYYACEEEKFLEGRSIEIGFSTDTIFFDTVFTTIGSTTKYLRVYNKLDEPISISEISLASGDRSVFRLNIDGVQGNTARDVKIRPKDSLYIFVEATIDPTGQNLPLVVKDSILFFTGDKMQDVNIMAWGQDVHYFSGDTIQTQTWNADKPYLIYNYLVVDSLSTLTIFEGVQVHFHRSAFLAVYGSLQVQGTAELPVVFQGDRLEELYDDVPGQWGTIALLGKNNYISYAEIKNAVVGIQIGNFFSDQIAEVFLENTMIKNTTAAGIYAFGADFTAYNSVIGKCGSAALALLRGGNYNIYHCTLANYGNFASNSSDPSLFVSNYFTYRFLDYEIDLDTTLIFIQDLEQANIVNCIITGNNENEFGFNGLDNVALNFNIQNSLLKINADSFDIDNPVYYENIILNEDPAFIDPDEFDFHLDTLSPVKDIGSAELINDIPELQYDYDGYSRLNDLAPDLGAFERIEGDTIRQ